MDAILRYVNASAVDSLPSWLRIAIAVAPPLAAALIAAFVALTNTINRRIERFKNLTDVYSKLPEKLNPGQTLEKLMLKELNAIEWRSTTINKWYRRVYFSNVVLMAAVYVPFMLQQTHIIDLKPLRSPSAPMYGLMIITVLYMIQTSIYRTFGARKARFEMIWKYQDAMEQLEKIDSENPLHPAVQKVDAPDSQQPRASVVSKSTPRRKRRRG
jgi:hypothetical protein